MNSKLSGFPDFAIVIPEVVFGSIFLKYGVFITLQTSGKWQLRRGEIINQKRQFNDWYHLDYRHLVVRTIVLKNS